MGARMAMPLRTLLPCLAVALVASGAVVIGLTGASAASGYLMRQADGALRGCAANVLSYGLVAMPGSGPAAGHVMAGACGIELRSASGQILIPAVPAVPGPAITAITAVRYQPQRMSYVYGPDDLRYVISGPAGPGSSGQLIAMTPLAGTGRATAGFAAAAGAVLVLLVAAAFVLTRAILRPLREAAGLAGKAGQDAAGRLEEVMVRLGMLANRDHGRCGPALVGLGERLHASRAAEATARRSAADMSGELGQACVQMRRPASILRGFAEYCRSQDRPPPAGLDQTMARLTGEITRMETLADRLRRYDQPDPGITAAREPAGPGATRLTVLE
jgi:signal transduction histidine kinase